MMWQFMTPVEDLFARLFHADELNNLQKERCLHACKIAVEAQSLPAKSLVRSSDVAEILAELKMDADTLVATLLSDPNVESLYDADYMDKQFGAATAQLVKGIRFLNQFKDPDVAQRSDLQNERLRQMLLAMTDDIRIMIVKLAYRVARLRRLKFEEPAMRQQIAEETQLIFAPLANRLGIAQLKWELEDLSFRFLHPDEYRKIADQLDANRDGREAYINSVIDTLKQLLDQHEIHAKISGRPKHIYSIWKKMQRKHAPIDELYDLRAVRIYVDSVKQCYEVLGLIHSHWSYIKDEFDDYIATPKDNGYQSIHTVVRGPQGKTVEIQIRTFEMHRHAEFGVAAHWRYKEGGKNIDRNLEQSIANIRQLLENSDDPEMFKEISTELQSQHIYVITPQNEIITLRQGATPLDFAYSIHTELGHGCRGAKVNGRIQPLTHVLKTGDKVEILSVKHGEPSRNWLNPNLGYLNSSSARHKVKNWFNKQNKAQNIQAGEALFNRELKRLNAGLVKTAEILKRLRCADQNELFEMLGKGQLNQRQLAAAIQEQMSPKQRTFAFKPSARAEEDAGDQAVYVVGGAQLKTHLAPCCHPQKGDEIVGYVTRGRGITVHRRDCPNILNLVNEEWQRLIEVSWSDAPSSSAEGFTAELTVTAFDRKGLLRDVMGVLTDLDINLIGSQTHTDSEERTVLMKLTLEVATGTQLGEVLDQIERIQNIESATISQL